MTKAKMEEGGFKGIFSDKVLRMFDERTARARNIVYGRELLRMLYHAHGHPKTASRVFTIDRRAVAASDWTWLTEAQVRGATALLVAAGLLQRVEVSGSSYRMTEKGLRRKPVMYRFAEDVLEAILEVTRLGRRILEELRAKAAKVAKVAQRTVDGAKTTMRKVISPKKTNPSEIDVYLGEKVEEATEKTLAALQKGQPIEQSALEDALTTIVMKAARGTVMTIRQRCFVQLARDWASGRYCLASLGVADSLR